MIKIKFRNRFLRSSIDCKKSITLLRKIEEREGNKDRSKEKPFKNRKESS
jgi:hypothetical protein